MGTGTHVTDEHFELGLGFFLELVAPEPIEAPEGFRRLQPVLPRVHQALVDVNLDVVFVVIVRFLRARRAGAVAGGDLRVVWCVGVGFVHILGFWGSMSKSWGRARRCFSAVRVAINTQRHGCLSAGALGGVKDRQHSEGHGEAKRVARRDGGEAPDVISRAAPASTFRFVPPLSMQA